MGRVEFVFPGTESWSKRGSWFKLVGSCCLHESSFRQCEGAVSVHKCLSLKVFKHVVKCGPHGDAQTDRMLWSWKLLGMNPVFSIFLPELVNS